MARTAASIQAEIDTIEAHLESSSSLASSVSADGVSIRYDRKDLARQLRQLHIELGRVNGTAPMIARSKVKGL